jgi:hypothetical protein
MNMKNIIFVLIYLVAILANAQNQKISEMTPASTVGGADFFPILQGGANKKATIAQIPAGGDVSGTVLNMVVNKLKGFSYAATSPANGNVYAFNTSTLQFEPVSISAVELDPKYTAFGVAKATTININGVTQDLSTSRIWTIPAVTDGDKGSIVISSGGLVWVLDVGSVGSSQIIDGSIANTDLLNSSMLFATGTGGTAPTWSASPVSLGGQATLNIPLASGTGVTSGTISKADYDKIIAAFGWGDHSTEGYLTNITWAMIPDAPAFLTSYTETDPLSPHLDQVYNDPTWIGELDYDKLTNVPAPPTQIKYKAGTNIVFSTIAADTIEISSVAGGGGGGGSIVSVGLDAPGGMSGGPAVTGSGGTLDLTLTLPAGNVKSDGAGSFIIDDIDLATDVDGVLPAANGGLTDGDKTDITVSGGGLAWNIDAGAVSSTEIANGGVANVDLANSTVGHTIGTTGTAPGYSASTTALGASTQLNIPMALTTGVTAGLISKVDYDKFILAHGWGNHAAMNYLTGVSAPLTRVSNTVGITIPGVYGNILYRAATNDMTTDNSFYFNDGSKYLKIGSETLTFEASRLNLTGNDVNSGAFKYVMSCEQTGLSRNVALFAGKKGSTADLFDNTGIILLQRDTLTNNRTLINFYNTGGVVGFVGATNRVHTFGGQTGDIFIANTLGGTINQNWTFTAEGAIKSRVFAGVGFKLIGHDNTGKFIDTTISFGGTGTVTQVTASEPGSTAINLEVTNQTTTPNVVLTYNGLSTDYVAGNGAIVPFPSSSISDGDKGDISTSSGGTVWAVDNGAISNAKMVNSTIGFTCGNTGTSPAWSVPTPSLGGTTQLNIPLAQNASVTAGLISKTQYDKFNNAASTIGNVQATGTAKGASFTAPGEFSLHVATATMPGIISTTAQEIPGYKTFINTVVAPKVKVHSFYSQGGGAYSNTFKFVSDDVNEKIGLKISATPAMVNQLTIAGGNTGVNPRLDASTAEAGSDANIGIDFIAKGTGLFDFDGRGVRTSKVIGRGSAPTLSDGDGTYYAEITGTDVAGKISIVTDGTEAGGNEVIINVTFAVPYTTAPYVVISPGNVSAAELTGTQAIFVAAPGAANGTTTTGFKFISGDVPLANGEYTFTYHVIQ